MLMKKMASVSSFSSAEDLNSHGPIELMTGKLYHLTGYSLVLLHFKDTVHLHCRAMYLPPFILNTKVSKSFFTRGRAAHFWIDFCMDC